MVELISSGNEGDNERSYNNRNLKKMFYIRREEHWNLSKADTKLIIKGHLRWTEEHRSFSIVDPFQDVGHTSEPCSAVTKRSFSRKWPFYIFVLLFKYVHSKFNPPLGSLAMQRVLHLSIYVNDKGFKMCHLCSAHCPLSCSILEWCKIQMQSRLLELKE